MNVDVASLDSSGTLTDAAALMAKRQIGSIIVTENDIPFGIITERDIVRRLGAGDEQFFRDARLGDACSHPLIVAESSLTVGEALDLMVQNKIHKLPVVGRGNLLGIVTIKDLAKFLSPSRTPSVVLSLLRAMSRKEKNDSGGSTR
jgi:CBS domain-containing protein